MIYKTTFTSMSHERVAWGLLIIIVLFVGLVRYRLADVPLERDEGEYAYAGQLILEGIPPYEGVYTMKLPGIYAAYALILSVFGQTHQGIHWGLLFINSATIVVVFLLAKRLFDSLAGIVSAASFAVLSVSQCVQGVFANAEHFVILFSTTGLLFLLIGCEQNRSWKLFISGILLALGFTMKQHGLMFCVLGVVYVGFDCLQQKPVPWLKMLLRLLSLSAGMLTVLTSLLLIMAWAGVFESFWFWTVDYTRTYVAHRSLMEGLLFFVYRFSAILRSAPLIWAIANVGLFFLLSTQICRSRKVFVFLFALFSFLSICPGFYFRRHYFVLLLPCASLLTGLGVWALSRGPSRFLSTRVSHIILFLLLFAGLGQTIYSQRDYLFGMTPFEVCRSTYGPNPFHESLEIADYLNDHTEVQDTIGILGSEPQIFFYSKRRSASGQVYMYPLMEPHDYALKMQKNFIHDIETKKPEYILDVHIPTSWLQNESSNKHIIDWKQVYLPSHYELVGTVGLYDDRTEYRWEKDIKPLLTENYILIYERKQDSE